MLFNLIATQPSFGTLRHGGGIYGEIVFRRILELGYPVSVIYDSSLWLNPEIEKLCKEHSVLMLDAKGRTIQDIVNEVKPGALYSPQPLDNVSCLKNCKVIVTVHDLRYIEITLDEMFWRYSPGMIMQMKNLLWKLRPGYVRKHRYKKLACFLNNPDIKFVVVSNHTLSSLRLHFPEYVHKTIPVYYSPSTIFDKPETRQRDADYFLLVSADRWEKNNLRAIMALDELAAEGRLNGKKVVVTGVKSATKFKYRFKSVDIFEFRGYVSDRELHQLYHDAYCFIYPSFNEGFGYPPLEAMSFGVPVLASPFSSISEICGDGALYFNPYSIEEIKMRIIQLENAESRKRLIECGRRQYEKVYKRQKEDLDKLIGFIYEQNL